MDKIDGDLGFGRMRLPGGSKATGKGKGGSGKDISGELEGIRSIKNGLKGVKQEADKARTAIDKMRAGLEKQGVDFDKWYQTRIERRKRHLINFFKDQKKKHETALKQQAAAEDKARKQKVESEKRAAQKIAAEEKKAREVTIRAERQMQEKRERAAEAYAAKRKRMLQVASTHRYGIGDEKRMPRGLYSAMERDSDRIVGVRERVSSINTEITAISRRRDAFRGESAARRMVRLELSKFSELEKAGIAVNSSYAKSIGMTTRRYQDLTRVMNILNQKRSEMMGTGGGGKDGFNWFGGAMGGWGSRMGGGVTGVLRSAGRQARYWGQLRVMYGMYSKVSQGMQTYSDLVGDTARAVRTAVTDVRDLNQAWIAQNEIADAAVEYLSKYRGSIKDFTEAVHQLTQAEMSRAEALRIAPNILAAASGLDAPIKDVSRLMVGLNEIFKDMDGFETDSARINRMLAVMSKAVKNEVTTIADLRRALGYIGPVAKQANMSFEELTATVALLNTNLFQASRAGTGIRQMLNAMSKNAEKLKGFNVEVDMSKPLQFARTMRQLGESIGSGALSGGELKNFLGLFGLRGAAPAAIIAQQFESFADSVQSLKDADIQDLLGMREIREKNVPAQFEILAKNVDLLIANILRGAIGGRDLAESLEKVNNRFVRINKSAFTTGKTLNTVFGGVQTPLILVAGMLNTHIRKLRLYNAAVASSARGVDAMMASQARLNKSFAVSNLYIMAATVAVFSAVWAYHAYIRKREEAIKQAGESAAKNRQEADELRRKAKTLRDLAAMENSAVDRTKALAKANDVARKAASEAGEVYDKQAASLSDAADALDRYAAAKDKVARADAMRQVDLIRQKYSGGLLKPRVGGETTDWDKLSVQLRSALGLSFAPVKKTAGASARLDEKSLKLAEFYADMEKLVTTLRANGSSVADIRKEVEKIVTDQNLREMLTMMADMANASGDATLYNRASAELEKLNGFIETLGVSADESAAKIKRSIAELDDSNVQLAWKIARDSVLEGMRGRVYKDAAGNERTMTRGQMKQDWVRRARKDAATKDAYGALSQLGFVSSYGQDGSVASGVFDRINDLAGGDAEKARRMTDAFINGMKPRYNELIGRERVGSSRRAEYEQEYNQLKNAVLADPRFNNEQIFQQGVGGLLRNALGPGFQKAIEDILNRAAGEKSDLQKLLDEYDKNAVALSDNTAELKKLNDSMNAIAARPEAAGLSLREQVTRGLVRRQEYGDRLSDAPALPSPALPFGGRVPNQNMLTGQPVLINLMVDQKKYDQYVASTGKALDVNFQLASEALIGAIASNNNWVRVGTDLLRKNK